MSLPPDAPLLIRGHKLSRGPLFYDRRQRFDATKSSSTTAQPGRPRCGDAFRSSGVERHARFEPQVSRAGAPRA